MSCTTGPAPAAFPVHGVLQPGAGGAHDRPGSSAGDGAAGNAVLAALDAAERDELLLGATPCHLPLWQVLSTEESAVYFPVSGCIAVLADVEGTMGPEVDMVGAEGMLGWQAMLGQVPAPWHALVCGAGLAWRVDAIRLRGMLARSQGLQDLCQRQLSLALARVVSSAACMRLHAIEQRLARRLLMHADCARCLQLEITHAMLASLLGVRRVGITRAAGALARRGLIAYRHGELRLLDRQGLMQLACPCYAVQRTLRDGLVPRP